MSIPKLHKSDVASFVEAEFQLTPEAPLFYKKQVEAVVERIFEEAKARAQETELKVNVKEVFDDLVVSARSPWTPQLTDLSDRQKLIFNLLRGEEVNFHAILQDKRLLPAVLATKDDTVLDEARDLVHKIFRDMGEQVIELQRFIDEGALNPDEVDLAKLFPIEKKVKSANFHMEMIIGDLLSLYPFLNPKDGSTIDVPVRDGGRWIIAKYKIDEIQLTPDFMGSPITAYGLSATSAPPLMLFKGTTYPTDKGFALSFLTDLNPFASVGSFAHKIGEKNIKKWLEAHTQESKAIIYGKSLGGIKSCLTAIKFPEHVKKVMAYGAPGFSTFDLKSLYKLEKEGRLPEIHAFCQKDDPAPYCDLTAKKGVNYYMVVGSKHRKGVLAHADMYSLHQESLIIKLNPKHEAVRIRRIALTALRTGLTLFVFPLLVVFYCKYLAVKHGMKAVKAKSKRNDSRSDV